MSGPSRPRADAIVIGAGPNGLAAAITLARAGHDVTVYEAADTVGGGTRSAELTAPGFLHDVCSAVHPLAAGSPFFQSVPLAEHGCTLVHPEVALAHPLDGGRAGVLHRSLAQTVTAQGADGSSWNRLFRPLVDGWDGLAEGVLGPIVRPPRHPVTMARFGVHAVRSATSVANRFQTDETRALFAGMAAHSFLPLERPLTASFGLLLGTLGHVHGWPFAEGGSQSIAGALTSYLEALGGTVVTGHRVERLDELPPRRVLVADVTPKQLAALAGDGIDSRARRKLLRFRYGPGACKIDYALSEPVPWTNADARRAGTLHLGGTVEEIASAEATVARGGHAEHPYVLVAQPSLTDPTRAPSGRHTLWAYCHVPNGSTLDVTDRITAQIERFAPGFRDVVIDQHVTTAAGFERYDANYVGGDISAGSHAGTQVILRPWPAIDPYRTPLDGVFLCSSSTPPGGGVHGMCGAHAARSALRWLGD